MGLVLRDDAWQPARRYLERLAATADWGEVLVAANLCFEPTVATLIRRELGTRAAAAHGDTVTPVLARAETQEWARRWMAGLTRFLMADEEHGSDNRAQAPRRAVARAARTRSTTGTYDYVGIVMAKSAEGDAVARCFAGRADVIEQPAFWEIRAPNRLVIPYDEISEELGYEIDAYSIQHEMSTHYGRMVATDDGLMLFSDPTEAMEHLLS